ncbi:hypothetical protein O9929_23910 [Vibrio lentus]|nr:hypothetical protein [Vibrio lentus]
MLSRLYYSRHCRFQMDNGDKVIFRPAISYVQNDFNIDTPTSSQHMDQSGVTDISFDLSLCT